MTDAEDPPEADGEDQEPEDSGDQTPTGPDLGRSYTFQSPALSSALNQIRESIAASIAMPTFNMPSMGIDPTIFTRVAEGVMRASGTSSLVASKALDDHVARAIAPATQAIAEMFAEQNAHWRRILKSFAELADRMFPENWLGVPHPSFAELEEILIDEGIPLMWVPGPQALVAILAAKDAAARRRVISNRWRGIVSDCGTVLEGVTHPELQHARGFALDCFHALRDGHTSPAQALAANLLDSLLGSQLEKADLAVLKDNGLKNKGKKFNLNDHEARYALTFAPVWCAQMHYFASRGDTVPASFGRNPTVHAVSRTQYKRINAVIGLMVVASVLKFFDTELSR
jgi:hypothetical protein